MPKKIINNFNGGELSPYLYGRADFPKYSTGCIKMENFIPLTYGGVTKRPGSKYIANTDGNNKANLVPFIVNVTDKYVLEFTANTIKVYKDEALLGVSINTPYTESEINELTFVQSVDVLFIAHKNHPVSTLSRYSETNWSYENVIFDFPPLLDEDESGTSIQYDNANRKLTADAGVFNSNHKGAYWVLKELRDGATKLIFSGSVDLDYTTSYSESMNVSFSNWTIETIQGANNVYIERSFDNVNFERYVTVGSNKGKADGTADKTFTFSSLEPESFNTFIRVAWEGKTQPAITASGHSISAVNGTYNQVSDINNRTAWSNGTYYIMSDSDNDAWKVALITNTVSNFSSVDSTALLPPTSGWSNSLSIAFATTDVNKLQFDLIADSEYLMSVYRITNVIDSQNAEVLVISNPTFDTEEITTWASSTSYAVGDVVKYQTVQNDINLNTIKDNGSHTQGFDVFDFPNYPWRYDQANDLNDWDSTPDFMADSTRVTIGTGDYLATTNGKSIVVRELVARNNYETEDGNNTFDQSIKYSLNPIPYSQVKAVAQQNYSTIVNNEQIFALSHNFLEEKKKIFAYTRQKTQEGTSVETLSAIENCYSIWEMDVTDKSGNDNEIQNITKIGEVHFIFFERSGTVDTLTGKNAQLTCAQICDGYIYFTIIIGDDSTPYGEINPGDSTFGGFHMRRVAIDNYRLVNNVKIYTPGETVKQLPFGAPTPAYLGAFAGYKYFGSFDLYKEAGRTVLSTRNTQLESTTSNPVTKIDTFESYYYDDATGQFTDEPFFKFQQSTSTPTVSTTITKPNYSSFSNPSGWVRQNLFYVHPQADGTVAMTSFTSFTSVLDMQSIMGSGVNNIRELYYQPLSLGIFEAIEAHTSTTTPPPNDTSKWKTFTSKDKTFGTDIWHEGAFSAYRGYPEAIAFYEKRLVFANTTYNPNTIWASRTDDFYNFLTGTLDAESLKLTLDSGRLNEIKWLVPSTSLVVGTSSSEWTLGSESDDIPITPTRFALKERTTFGSNNTNPIYVEGAVLFFMRQGRKLREWDFNYFNLESEVPDLTLLAEHITTGGIISFAHQQQPNNVLWMVRNDGQLLGLTYDKTQKVFAWHRHVFDGTVESIAVLPAENTEDKVYISVLKGSKRSVCCLDNMEWGSNFQTEYSGLDLYVHSTGSTSQTISGLSHLDGLTVTVKKNGSILETKSVGSGSITLTAAPASGDHIYVGLPFTSTIAPMYFQDPELVGDRVTTNKATIHFKDTVIEEDVNKNIESPLVGQKENKLDPIKFSNVNHNSAVMTSDIAEAYVKNHGEYLQTLFVQESKAKPCTILTLGVDIDV
jgi:hypothetical protein